MLAREIRSTKLLYSLNNLSLGTNTPGVLSSSGTRSCVTFIKMLGVSLVIRRVARAIRSGRTYKVVNVEDYSLPRQVVYRERLYNASLNFYRTHPRQQKGWDREKEEKKSEKGMEPK